MSGLLGATSAAATEWIHVDRAAVEQVIYAARGVEKALERLDAAVARVYSHQSSDESRGS